MECRDILTCVVTRLMCVLAMSIEERFILVERRKGNSGAYLTLLESIIYLYAFVPRPFSALPPMLMEVNKSSSDALLRSACDLRRPITTVFSGLFRLAFGRRRVV